MDHSNRREIPTDVGLILCQDWPDNRGSTVFYTLPVGNSSHLSRCNPKIHWGNSETVDYVGAKREEERRKNGEAGNSALALRRTGTGTGERRAFVGFKYINFQSSRSGVLSVRGNYTIGRRSDLSRLSELRVNERGRRNSYFPLRRAMMPERVICESALSSH